MDSEKPYTLKDAFDCYYKIGDVAFRDISIPEIRLTLEGITMCIAVDSCDTEGGLRIWHETDDGKPLDKIVFHPDLDQYDAMRLAGLLVAWAEAACWRQAKSINKPKENLCS